MPQDDAFYREGLKNSQHRESSLPAKSSLSALEIRSCYSQFSVGYKKPVSNGGEEEEAARAQCFVSSPRKQ